MQHPLISLLTTAAIALHAMLGCCAHHLHHCDAHGDELAVVALGSGGLGSGGGRDHHHEHQGGDQHRVVEAGASWKHHGNAANAEDRDGLDHASCGGTEFHGDCGHRGDHHQSCEDGRCSFVSSGRNTDIDWMLSWLSVPHFLADTSVRLETDGSIAFQGAFENPPGRIADSSSLRARFQVWRL